MRSSFQELFSRFMNKGPGNCFCSKKELDESGVHICDSNQFTDIFRMISNPSPNSSPCRKKTESENRRPSDEENFCPSENNHHLTSNKKQSKLKNSKPNEFLKAKKMKITDDDSSPKDHRKKRDKTTNGVSPDIIPRRTSPSDRHRRSGSLDGNCLRKNKEKKPLQNGDVTRTHSHSINSQNLHVTHEPRSHLKSCPTLRPTPSPSPDLPPKHPSHLSKLNHRHRQNGIVLSREPSPLPNGDHNLDDNNTQVSDEVVSTEREIKLKEQKTVDIRRVVQCIKKRSVPVTPLIQEIYSENKKKVESVTSHDLLQTSNIITYRQPCESPRYYNSIFSYKQKRPQFIKLLQNRLMKQYKKEYLLCMEQDNLQEKWEASVQECNECENKKLIHNRTRDQYERYYPEIKRQREQERIAKSIGESEVCEDSSLERHESVAAVIPAMVTDVKERDIRFKSRNGYIEDITKFTEDIKSTNIWTEDEKITFKEKVYQYPKNFELIATCLQNKSVADCIEYYYLNKKHVNFKHSVRGSSVKRRKNRLQPKALYLYVKPRGTSMTSPDQSSSIRQRRAPDWTPDEVEKLRSALLQHGRSWNKVQQAVGKPHLQCKMFYNDFSSIEEYGLQQAMEERIKRKAKERQDKLTVDSEDPLPPSTIKYPEELSDTDSPPRRRSDPLPLKEGSTDLLLLEHSYHTQSSQAVTRKVCHSSVHGADPTKLTMLSPATHTRLMKALRDSCHCRSGLPRVRKYRRSSAAALLQPSNHRRLSSSLGGTLSKRTALAAERSRVSQERPSSDTTLEHRAQSHEISYPAVMTSTEPTTPLISSEVVTELDTPTAGGCEKREQRNSSDYDSEQEGGRLVIDTDADDVIEEPAHPVTQGGSFTSLPDLERVEDQEVFQSDETSELSPDVLTELSPTQPIRARFEDAWAYRSSDPDLHWSTSETTSFKFEEYSDLEPDTIGSAEGDILVERINRINFPRTDRPPKKWNHLSRIYTTPKPKDVEVSRPIPIKLKHKHPKASLPIEIQRTLKSLEGHHKISQDLVWSDHKRNGHSPPPKEHKRFKSEVSSLPNGNSLKEEPLEDKEAIRLQYLAQCRPDLYQQHGILPYPPIYHPLGQLLLQNPYLSPPLLPPTGKLILPPGIQFPINKPHEPILVQNPMASTMSHSFPPPLLLQGSGLYPIRYPPGPPPEGPTQTHDNHRGPKSNT